MKLFKLLILLFPFFLYSQIEIKGNVIDSSNVAIESANAVLLTLDGKIITGVITNGKGTFKLFSKTGNYKLKISSLGYNDWIKNISVKQQDQVIDLGQITLEEQVSELESVFLVSEKKSTTFKKNITVYTINTNVKKASINSASILRKLPGIEVTDDIKLEGRSGIIIQINGKEKFSNADEAIGFLRSLSAEEIKSIEVNNTPGVQYGNEVNGVVNVILVKDDTQGINGTVQSYFDTGEYANYGGSLYLNYRRNKINAYTNLRNDNENNLSTNDSRTTYSQPNLNIIEREKDVESPNKYYAQVGIDYDINIRNSLSLTTNFNFKKTDQRINNSLNFSNNSNTIDSIINFTENKDLDYFRSHVNLNYTGILDTVYKQKIKVNANYITDNTDEISVFNQGFSNSNGQVLSPFLDFRGDLEDEISLKSGSIDYEIFLKKAYELYAGSRFVQTQTESEAFYESPTNQDIPNSVFQSSNSNYKENLFSSYTTLMRYKPIWGFELGLRYELATISGQSSGPGNRVKKTFNGLFPSLLVRYNLNKNNRFVLQAKQLAGRPKFYQLDENIRFVSPNRIIQGNLGLRQFNLYLLSLRYTFKSKYTVSLRYDYIDNYIPQTLFVTESDDNIIRSTYENAGRLSGLQLTISFPVKISNTWKIRNYINSFYTKSTANDIRFKGLDYSTANLFYRITNSFSLPKDYFINFSFAYKTTAQINQTETDPLYSLDFTVTKSFFENRLKCNLEVNDILRSYIENRFTNINNIAFERSDLFQDSRRISMRVSYDFGSRKIKYNRRKRDGIENDKGRLNKQ